MVSLERLVLFIPEKLNIIRLVINNILVFFLTAMEQTRLPPDLRVRLSAKVCTPALHTHF